MNYCIKIYLNYFLLNKLLKTKSMGMTIDIDFFKKKNLLILDNSGKNFKLINLDKIKLKF